MKTDKPKLKALLDMPWHELRIVPRFAKAVQDVLNPGPWHHGACNCAGACVRCGKQISSGTGWKTEFSMPCPVPPPITAEPEVVAERLRDKVPTDGGLIEAAYAVGEQTADGGNEYFMGDFWFGFRATPTQRILTCLLALDPEFCKE